MLTLKTLNKYYLLEEAISDCEESIAYIEARLIGSPKIDTSGIPKNPTPKNRTEETYIELAQRKADLEKMKRKYEEQKKEVEEYINCIDDLLVKRIFEKRVLQNKRWSVVAKELGGNNTTDSVKKMYYRYLNNEVEKI